MPASPENKMTRPSPAFACAQRRSKSSSFLLAIDERCLSGTQRFETALEAVLAQHPPSALRLGKAFEVLEPEVLQRKDRSDQSPRAVGDHDRVRLGQSQQSGGEIRPLAQNLRVVVNSRSDRSPTTTSAGGDA